MGRIIKYLLPFKKKIVIIIMVSLGLSTLTLFDAWLMGRLTDAIFYRTKGLPISLTWEKDKTVEYKDLSIVLNKNTAWSGRETSDLKQAVEKLGINVLSFKNTGESVRLRLRASKELANDSEKMVNDLLDHLKPRFGNLEAYIVVEKAKASQARLIFPGIYTVYLIPVIIVVVYFLIGLFRYTQSFLVGSIGQKTVMRLRNEIYQNLQNLSLSYFEGSKTGQTGQLISRVTNDIDAINYLFTTGIFEMLLEPLVVVLGLIWGFILNWKLTLIFFLVFPLIAFPIDRLSRMLRKVNIEIMNKLADITSVLEETITGIRVVKAFGMEKYEVDRFRRETQDSYRAAMRGIRVGKIFLPIIEFMVSIALAIFLAFAGSQVLHERLTPGEFFTFIFLMSFMANPIRKVSGVFSQIPRSLAAGERVFELIDQKSEVVEKENPIEVDKIEGKVEFQDVSFGYNPENLVLSKVNLTVEPGEVVALVGPSGAGKSTMVNLIARFYDPVVGVIKIDGYDLRELKLETFRKQLGIVPQETILFRGTIAENIAYGKIEASEAEIIAAAKAANVHEFVSQMPDGYLTRVGSRGATLSGGQKQRVAIARALLRDPKVLMLDEATSALDTQSEQLVQEALNNLMKNRTCFVIAHRLSTIMGADRIVVMDQGKIVEIGNHQELLERGGLYARLYHTQFKEQDAITNNC